MFSVIRIDKQSLNHKFLGFISILSVPWGLLRTKFTCHATVFYWSCIFFVCFCGTALMLLCMATMGRCLHSDDINTLSVWGCKSKVYEPHSATLINQNFEIPGFGVSPVLLIVSHLHTDITRWNKTNNAGKIFISKIKYLKMLRIYYRRLIVKFSIGLLRRVFHWSVQ